MIKNHIWEYNPILMSSIKTLYTSLQTLIAENKRTRAWRRHQARRVFKARLKRVGAWQLGPRKLWHEIQDEKGYQCYRTTGTPCSCYLCRGESFNRMAAKKEERAMIKENL